MSWYPQIGSGSIAQFPLTRSQRWRTIINDQDLTDSEAGSISALFAASQGSYGAFTFLDPLANLLGWSEDFSQAGWQAGLLQNAPGVPDPLGTNRASSVSNANPGTQTLQQTLGIEGSYVTCFSVYLRSDTAGTVALQRDSTQITVPVGPVWQRAFLSGTGATGAVQSGFSIEVAAGQTIDVWGPQVEAQPYPSAYKQTTTALGIYDETYFEGDELKITNTSVGLSSCEISLLSRVLI
jgi:hypothetical protein